MSTNATSITSSTAVTTPQSQSSSSGIWSYLPSNPFSKTSTVTSSVINRANAEDLWQKQFEKDIQDPKRNPDQLPPLHFACHNGNFGKVEEILERYPDMINKKSKNGWTPLIIAAKAGMDDIVDFLLTRSNIDLNLQSDNEYTALMYACENGYSQAAKLLLDQEKINFNHTDKLGWNAFFFACRNGLMEIVEILIEKNVDLTQRKKDTGSTGFIIACRNDNVGVAQLLLDYEVDINETDFEGRTALLLSSFNDQERTNIIEFLAKQKNLNVHQKDKYNRTALHHACMRGHLNNVAALLKIDGVDINETDSWENTALSIASSCEADRSNIIEFLAKQKNLNVNQETNRTALHKACKYGHPSNVAALLKIDGVNINESNFEGKTPLIMASSSEKDRSYVIELLTKQKNLNVNHVDKNNRTALHNACKYGHPNNVAALLKIDGVNPNALDKSDLTPLHIAAWNAWSDKERLDVVKTLLTHKGIDLNPKERSCHWTPLHLAAKLNHKDIAAALIVKGAIIDERDDLGQTPLHLAAANPEITDLLLKHGANPHLRNSLRKTPGEISLAKTALETSNTFKLATEKKENGDIIHVFERQEKDIFKLDNVGVLEEFPYWRDRYTNDLYPIEKSWHIEGKSLTYFVFTPLHTLYVVGKSFVFLAMDIGTIASHAFAKFRENFKASGLFSSLNNFAKSFVIDIPISFASFVWKIVRTPIYAGGMLCASFYGTVDGVRGRKMLNYLGLVWQEKDLLHWTGLQKVGNLTTSTIEGVAKYALKNAYTEIL